MSDMHSSALDPYKALFNLSGKRIVVIGAGSGIGEAGALALAAHGGEVLSADLSLEAATATSTTIVNGGGSATAAAVDIGDAASIQSLLDDFGPPDAVVITPAINVRKRMLDITEEEFNRVVSLNLTGSFNAITIAGRMMAENGGGSIVGVGSIRAQVVEPGQGVYSATKAGVVQMIKTIAAELGPQNVRANALLPGVVETPLTTQIKNNKEWYDAYANKGALGRWAQPIEMAGPIVYLCSDASSFVTGSAMLVDGGWTAIDGRFNPPL